MRSAPGIITEDQEDTDGDGSRKAGETSVTSGAGTGTEETSVTSGPGTGTEETTVTSGPGSGTKDLQEPSQIQAVTTRAGEGFSRDEEGTSALKPVKKHQQLRCENVRN